MRVQEPLAKTSAVILAGGLGTRLRAAVTDRPKVMAPVHGRPFITYLLDQVAARGIRHAVLCTGYMADQVRRDLGEQYRGIRLSYSAEPEPLGTGGALALAAHLCTSEHVLAMNGDSYCDADLGRLWECHLAHEAVATLQLVDVPDVSRYGRVRTDAVGHVVEFEEKGGAGRPGQINAGIYCLSRKLLLTLVPGKNVSLERKIFPDLIGRGLYAVSGGGHFLDIGTPQSYAQAETFFFGPPGRRRFVALDRDGTLIVERNYLSDPAGVELLPGATAGLRRLREMGLGLVVVTNQSGIARGYYDVERLQAIHQRMGDLLAAQGVVLDGIYFCPHLPEDRCGCRKPEPDLLLAAATEHDFAVRDSFIIGDKECDLLLGRRVGATTLLVRTGYGASIADSAAADADYQVNDLEQAAEVIQTLLAKTPAART